MGPLVGPLLSPRQAAVRGGHCGPNILAAYKHLSRDRWTAGPAVTSWWDEFLGEAGPALAAYVASFPDEGVACVPAVILEDQSKAFERLSHAWLVEVLRRWGLPRWLLRGLLDQVWRRAVRSGLGGRLGPVRLLLRGLGMGGTASVLLWNMGYDPVSTAVELATAVEIPSYVDDGEMLAYGPKQVVAASVMLLVAGHCAGLVAEAHNCKWLATRGVHLRALALAAIFRWTPS